MDMSELERERENLVKADNDIAAGEKRISDQENRIATLRADGHDVEKAEMLLATLRKTLREWLEHREMIIATIARLEQQAAKGRKPV